MVDLTAVDKIFGRYDQHDEFRRWCEEHNPDALQYFYEWYWSDCEKHPIAKFPTSVDMWMLKNCPIAWVVERIRNQYGLDQERTRT